MQQRSKTLLERIADAARRTSSGEFCRCGLAGIAMLGSLAGAVAQESRSVPNPLQAPQSRSSQAVAADYRTVDQQNKSLETQQTSGVFQQWFAPEPTANPIAAANVVGSPQLPHSAGQAYAGRLQVSPQYHDGSQRYQQSPASLQMQPALPLQTYSADSGLSMNGVSTNGRPEEAAAGVVSRQANAVGTAPPQSPPPIHVYPKGIQLKGDDSEVTLPYRSVSSQQTFVPSSQGGHSFGNPVPLPVPSMQLPPMQPWANSGDRSNGGSTAGNFDQQATPLLQNMPDAVGGQTLPVPFEPPTTLQLPPGSDAGGVNGDTHLPSRSDNHVDSVPMGDDLSWWENDITTSILRDRQPLPMSLQQCLGLAMSEAPELQILKSDWYIQQLEVTRRDAAFDWTGFVNSVWNRDSTPVGSQLDGATGRLRSRTASATGGIRRLNRDGAEVELSQNMGIRSSNSQFINPNNQGNSRLALQYERPLLRGAGEDYNTATVKLAEIDKDTAFDRFRAGVQDHLLETATAYWALVLRRGRFVQAVSSWDRSKAIAEEMATRVDIDVTPTMLDRTRSEVANRLANSIRAEHEVLAAQDALLRLIYGARFTEFTSSEVVTETLPMKAATPLEPESQIQTALASRPEVHRSIREIKAAAVRYHVAENEVLPVLNLVLTGYVAGLRGNNDIGGSFLNQFSQGEPGAGIALNYELPCRNRAANAAAEQGKVSIKRMQAQLEATIADVTEDVRAQVIERNLNGAVLQQQLESLARNKRMLQHTHARREALADGTRVADLYLENLLQMQSRLENAEFTYLQSQVRFAIADNGLLRAIASLDTIAEQYGGACEPGIMGTAASAGMHAGPALNIDDVQQALAVPSNGGVLPASYRQ